MSLDRHDSDRVKRHWHTLFSSSLRSYAAIQTPFSGYLEVPREWVPFIEQWGPEFGEQVEQMRELHRRFMLAILEQCYGSLTTTVSSEDLLEDGFDDTATAPDPIDYF
jgi:hypothetical protein